MSDGTAVAEARPTPARPEINPAGRVDRQPVITPDVQKDITQVTAKGMSEGIKGDPRRALILVRDLINRNLKEAKGKKSAKDLKNQLKVLRESKDPQDRALALDFEIAQKQFDLAQIEHTISLYQNELGNPDITTEAKGEYENVVKQLEVKRNGVVGKDSNIQQKGAIQVIEELRTERQNISGEIPNSTEYLARQLGASAEEAETNPLQAVFNKLESIKTDKKAEAVFIKQLDASGFPKDAQKELSNVLRIMKGEPTKIEKTAKGALKFAGIFGLLNIIMLWLASKQSSQGQAMG